MPRTTWTLSRLLARVALALGALALAPAPLARASAQAVVRYGGGRLVKGVQLLAAYGDSNAFYYLPPFPRLAMRPDSTFEFLILKYVGTTDSLSGGLFHALVEFSLPADMVADLEKELQKQLPEAHIAGMVPLSQSAATGEDALGSFQIVSATLSDTRAGGFTRSLITSGRAPTTSGSKAALAALLRPQGATLLWNSLTGPTSDVSVAIHAAYDAVADGYNAKVTADVTTIYQHFSLVGNEQHEYTRRQIRDIVDDLHRTGALNVEVVDRTAGTTIKASDMEALLQLVTDKLTELMFDHTAGWAADPQRETAVESNQIPGRQTEGFFAQLFGGGDTKYYTDNQYVLKSRKDIRQNTFTLTLSKKATVRVPVDAAGNLGGLFTSLPDRDRYFRIVDLADPAFQFRPVHFQVDGAFVDSFRQLINFVAVNVRKTYPSGPAFTSSLKIASGDVKDGKTLAEVLIPRLGLSTADWGEYEYQVRWSLAGGTTLSLPAVDTAWITSGDAAVALTPPLEQRAVEIDADRQLFKQYHIATAVVQFATVIAGKTKLDRQVTLRAGDADPTSRLVIYCDPGQPVAYRISWYGPGYHHQDAIKGLDGDYVYVTHPDAVPPADSTAASGGHP